jgi:hypothetical protein
MIVFELTMPHVGSWNGKWSGADKRYIRTIDERRVPKECWDKDFHYRWDDGWCACVSVKRIKASEAKKLKMRSSGFCGYDWMIRSIIECGCILTDSERIKNKRMEVK